MRLLLVALAVFATACSDTPPSSNTPPPANCVDNDKDGFDSCSDCNDADEKISPGAAEKCGDAVDNNCNNQIDEGCAPAGKDAGTPGPDAGQPGSDAGQPGPDAGAGFCTGTQTQPCGKAGSSCVQKCVGGTFGGCELPGGPVDTQNDPANCGECGNACPTPAHAAATCKAGVCGRGACEAGYFDLDGAATPGCEASCTKASATSAVTCTGGASTVTLSQMPVHEAALGGFTASSSVGAKLTGGTFTNSGSHGEVSGTAPVRQTGGSYTNQGGVHSLQQK